MDRGRIRLVDSGMKVSTRDPRGIYPLQPPTAVKFSASVMTAMHVVTWQLIDWDYITLHYMRVVSWGTRATSPRTHSTLLLLQNRVEWLFTLHSFLNSDPVLRVILYILGICFSEFNIPHCLTTEAQTQWFSVTTYSFTCNNVRYTATVACNTTTILIFQWLLEHETILRKVPQVNSAIYW